MIDMSADRTCADAPAEGRGDRRFNEDLGPLFHDPDARGARRWSAMFDPQRCERVGQLTVESLFTQSGGMPALNA